MTFITKFMCFLDAATPIRKICFFIMDTDNHSYVYHKQCKSDNWEYLCKYNVQWELEVNLTRKFVHIS